MKITLARHSGFCMGVRNAILRIVHEINKTEGELFVYGPLIHNPQTIDVLHTRGQVIIKKESGRGCHTIITGDRDHAEVTGLMSYASHGVSVISDLGEISSIPPSASYVLVSQTTFDRSLFNRIVDRILARYPNVQVHDTICDSTRYRQEDVIKGILQGNDTLVVVGGKNSANTKRLAQIGRDNMVKTLHVETEEELNESDFADSKSVLVTAGTSTPGWIINNILEKLYDINFRKGNIVVKAVISLLQFIVRTNLFSSLAAYYITLMAMNYAGIAEDRAFPTLSFLYIFSMYTINNYFDKNLLKLSNPYKYDIYKKYGLPLLLVSIASMAVSIHIATRFSLLSIAVIIGSYALGFIYSTGPIKVFVKHYLPKMLRKIYNSKIVVCFGWTIITVLVPMIEMSASGPAVISFSAYVLALIFLRTALLDMIAFQGDLILGRETLPVLVGTRAIAFLSLVISLVAMACFGSITVMMGRWLYLTLLAAIVYYEILMYVIQRLNYLISLKYELLVDVNLFFIISFFFLIRFLL
ncbi:MAG TPA: hypothetical protein PKN50_03710 [Spirochaetota bacterium]|nr:hypothetical protein [Spirochaetota bacterium]